MNYYIWLEAKAVLGSIFFWDAIFTIKQYYDWDRIAYGFVHFELGPAAQVSVMFGTFLLTSCLCGGFGVASNEYKMLSD